MSKRKNDFPAALPAGQGTGQSHRGQGCRSPGVLGTDLCLSPEEAPGTWDGMECSSLPSLSETGEEEEEKGPLPSPLVGKMFFQ